LLGFGLIALGFTTGIVMANNRNPISDTIMSSIFGLLGATIAYMFIKKDSENEQEGKTPRNSSLKMSIENKKVFALFLILFSTSFLYGTHHGGRFRMENEEYGRYKDFEMKVRNDSLEIWRKQQEEGIELEKLKNQIYYQKIYDTWSENEKKRFDKSLNLKKDSIPEVPDYLSIDTAVSK
jgi:hypothetical protein